MANTQQTDPFPSGSTPNSGGSKKDAKSKTKVRAFIDKFENYFSINKHQPSKLLLFKNDKNKILDPPTIEGVAQLIKTGKGIDFNILYIFFY